MVISGGKSQMVDLSAVQGTAASVTAILQTVALAKSHITRFIHTRRYIYVSGAAQFKDWTPAVPSCKGRAPLNCATAFGEAPLLLLPVCEERGGVRGLCTSAAVSRRSPSPGMSAKKRAHFRSLPQAGER